MCCNGTTAKADKNYFIYHQIQKLSALAVFISSIFLMKKANIGGWEFSQASGYQKNLFKKVMKILLKTIAPEK
jgi:hypothetical protein